jgi:tryptophan synthase beta chain
MKNLDEIIYLPPKDLPEAWYNVLPDLPEPLPPLKDPETGPSRKEAMKKIYVNKCLEYDENYKDRWVPLPENVRNAYIHAGRPTPLNRAWRMEKFLDTPARIYYKREGTSPTGSYKILSDLAQIGWAKEDGYDRVFTCSSGTQGSALCYAAAQLGLKAVVFIYAAAYDSRPGRVLHFKQMGAEVVRTPSDTTEIGRQMRKEDPNQPGSWLTSAKEMLEVLGKEKVRHSAYLMGSGNTHNILFLTLMGLELKKQLELAGEDMPDVIVDCAGAGGNWSGICLPFVKDRLDGKTSSRFVACQPEHFACFSDGKYEYVDGFITNPLMKSYALGWRKDVPQCQAKGLQIPHGAIIPSYLRHKGIMEPRKFPEKEVAKAALQWIRTEGYIPAIEATYAIKGGIEEALRAKEEGEKRVIVINISGHGYYDVDAYKAYLELIGE